MTKEEAIAKLKEIAERCNDEDEHRYDKDDAHWDADLVLIEYIGDKEIAAAWYDVPKWYS